MLYDCGDIDFELCILIYLFNYGFNLRLRFLSIIDIFFIRFVNYM